MSECVSVQRTIKAVRVERTREGVAALHELCPSIGILPGGVCWRSEGHERVSVAFWGDWLIQDREDCWYSLDDDDFRQEFRTAAVRPRLAGRRREHE